MEELLDTYDRTVEYAFGDFPTYSLSKALLNIGTLMLNKQIRANNRYRIFSACPGNFNSPMLSPDDTENVRSAADCAEAVMNMALDLDLDRSYAFFRNGMPISI